MIDACHDDISKAKAMTIIWKDAICAPTISPRADSERDLLVRAVQILADDLGHGEHVHPVLFEDSAHRIIAADLALVARVLEVVCPDIFPDFLHRLGT